MKKEWHPLKGDLVLQTLGLTDQHIDYCECDINHQIQAANQAKGFGIHQQMRADFQALVTSAAHDHIEINVASGFRSFERQLLIWNNKFNGITPINNHQGEQVNIAKLSEFKIVEAIMLYSALPGASRHHWGCDIDIYSKNLLNEQPLQLEPWEYSENGPMAALSAWLNANASRFGFYFPYDSFRGGIAAEPWHLSYAPIAQQYQSALTIEQLQQHLVQTDIGGKQAIIDNLPSLFEHYINNVNPYNQAG